MIEPYPVPLAHEEPLAGVTRSLALRALEFWDPEESDLEACARLDGVGGFLQVLAGTLRASHPAP